MRPLWSMFTCHVAKELEERTADKEGQEEEEEGDPSLLREPLLEDKPRASQ